MRLGLTRRLSGLLLMLSLGTGAPAQASEAQLGGEEQTRYLAELKRLYLTKDERKALLAHSNALLDTYALRAGYQLGKAPAQRSDLRYQLSVAGPGELLVRQETRAEKAQSLAVSNQRLSVFGLDPYIRYECPTSGITCVLTNPADGSPWITVLRDHQGAADLAKAISFLIRNLQKN
ncbi:hypothetical protein [Pseudomonas subflava]|uniref:hypothetical protein n=1 Tax=Pseudomonas subflava TaxID=2952933 RepID=UPI002079221B|nr:hypothetical protein [Pseudomonas subflava]